MGSEMCIRDRSTRVRAAKKSTRARTFGPRDDLNVLATLFAAAMFARCASIPRTRDFFPCSCARRKTTARLQKRAVGHRPHRIRTK